MKYSGVLRRAFGALTQVTEDAVSLALLKKFLRKRQVFPTACEEQRAGKSGTETADINHL